MQLPLNSTLAHLPVYQPGRPIEEVARELNLPAHEIIKMASNENPLGPSPKALEAMRQDAIAIESSTLTTEWIKDLAAAARARGVAFLDAPVTGSKAQASTGALTFLVGGEAEVVERARPVLAAMGSNITHLGPNGSGSLLKLINNFLCGVQAATLAEAIAMIERSGLDVRQAVAVLGGGAPGSPLVKMLSQRMLDRAYEPNFLVPLMAKDLAYASATFANVRH